ncbi:MAG: hypothetical protein A3C90_02715 [Candidatus Magasanikbacteria bacterium RIFCSPHIGHO2_02_FULL_51_14]|uniref:Uncharacterized protein n=1 Tax=Candidatus Magasanikbacteria bacterium RIFCSPHIGHO2_02_FULL_51_14 TaxID=1798683 RepID=A0A1F6MP07_9BACT|nr:MAG: hypothetical protein A3C90_02715 [Candidatus Magasanikbacteria bacterium RIFCSPHIGHO2_02_FULL_51_14]
MRTTDENGGVIGEALLSARYLVGAAILFVARNLPIIGALLALWVMYAFEDVGWFALPMVVYFAFRIDRRMSNAERGS